MCGKWWLARTLETQRSLPLPLSPTLIKGLLGVSVCVCACVLVFYLPYAMNGIRMRTAFASDTAACRLIVCLCLNLRYELRQRSLKWFQLSLALSLSLCVVVYVLSWRVRGHRVVRRVQQT